MNELPESELPGPVLVSEIIAVAIAVVVVLVVDLSSTVVTHLGEL